MSKCQLCFRAETARNKLNKHHIKGRKYPDVMKLHSQTCHWYAQWITNIYLLHGWEDDLSEAMLVEAYQRTVTMQRDGRFTIRLFD